MAVTSSLDAHSGAPEHYDALLAEVYAWMIGDFEAAARAAVAELQLSIDVNEPRRALDLGAGLGVHAIPLATRGWQVTAVDTSRALLDQLATRAAVRIVHGDLADATQHLEGPFDLIVCMGDTLTHLDSNASVELALRGAARVLAPNGTLVLRFRDYATRALVGAERFLLVRGDANRVMTCCLDYEDDRVLVTDLVHERVDATWTLRKSSYRKLRLSASAVVDSLTSLGLDVVVLDAPRPWIHVVATRPVR